MPAQQSIKRITSYLFLLRIFRMSLSVVTLIFSAKYFGVSMERDMWILVTTLIATVGSAIWGPISETFRAKFIFLKESEGEKDAISKTISLIVFIILSALLVSLILLFFSKNLALTMITSPTGGSTSLFISLLFIMIPTLLINQLTNIGISILNAYDIYYIPEIIGAISALLNIGIIILFAPVIGIYSLAISQYAAILILLAVVLLYIKRLHLFKKKAFFPFKFSDVKVFLLFALPFFFPYFVGQCGTLSEKWLAGLLGEGNISSLDYARQFSLVFQSVISSVLTTVMIPMLARAYMKKDREKYTSIFKENLTACFTILALSTPILYGAAVPLCDFFFSHGKVEASSLEIIISLIRFYSITFIGILLYIITGYALLASNQGKQYAFWGVTMQITVIILNILLIRFIGIYIFPLSSGIAHLLGAIAMGRLLWIENRKIIYLCILKYIMILFAISFLVYLFNEFVVFKYSIVQLLLNIPLLAVLILLFSRGLDLNLSIYIHKCSQKIRKIN